MSVPHALCAVAEGLPAWGGYLPGHAEVGDAAAFPEVFGAVGGQAAGAAVAVEAAEGFVPVGGAGGVVAVGAVALGDRRFEPDVAAAAAAVFDFEPDGGGGRQGAIAVAGPFVGAADGGFAHQAVQFVNDLHVADLAVADPDVTLALGAGAGADGEGGRRGGEQQQGEAPLK